MFVKVTCKFEKKTIEESRHIAFHFHVAKAGEPCIRVPGFNPRDHLLHEGDIIGSLHIQHENPRPPRKAERVLRLGFNNLPPYLTSRGHSLPALLEKAAFAHLVQQFCGRGKPGVLVGCVARPNEMLQEQHKKRGLDSEHEVPIREYVTKLAEHAKQTE